MIDYKNELIPIIKWLAVDLNEVIIDIHLNDGVIFNTIEWRKEEDKIYLHKLVESIDYQFDFDEFDEQTKKEIHDLFMTFLN
jgi:hypothetical protein